MKIIGFILDDLSELQFCSISSQNSRHTPFRGWPVTVAALPSLLVEPPISGGILPFT